MSINKQVYIKNHSSQKTMDISIPSLIDKADKKSLLGLNNFFNIKIIDNKLYIFYTLLISIFTFLLNLNYFASIYKCALVFSTIIIVVNTMTVTFGRFDALKSLAFSIIVSFVYLGKMPYYINNRIVNGLILASFLSLMISNYYSTYMFQKLQKKNQFSNIKYFIFDFSGYNRWNINEFIFYSEY